MSAPVIFRDVIARQAQAAAQASARGLEVLNPYCEHFQPEHHRVWAESFAQAVCVPESAGAA